MASILQKESALTAPISPTSTSVLSGPTCELSPLSMKLALSVASATAIAIDDCSSLPWESERGRKQSEWFLHWSLAFNTPTASRLVLL